MEQNEAARERLFATARDAGGIFTLAQARDLGVTDRMLQGLLRRAQVQRVHARIYRVAAVPWSWDTALRAAVEAVGDRPGKGLAGCASHAAAARWLGAEGVACGQPEVCVPWPWTPRLTGVRVHCSRDLSEGDITCWRDIRTTTGVRTVIDLAARLDRLDRMALVDEMICIGGATRKRLHRRAEELSNGRAGVRTIIDVTAPGAEGIFWSAMERTFGTGLAGTGLPMPAFNAPLRHAGELVYADALWDQFQVVGELQSLRFHDKPAQRQRDAERLSAFAAMGLRTLVFTWRDVFERFNQVLETIRAALRLPAE